jgi:hypothetical protein
MVVPSQAVLVAHHPQPIPMRAFVRIVVLGCHKLNIEEARSWSDWTTFVWPVHSRTEVE